MGINNLMKLLTSKAPSSVKELEITDYATKVVACDATIVRERFAPRVGHVRVPHCHDIHAEELHVRPA